MNDKHLPEKADVDAVIEGMEYLESTSYGINNLASCIAETARAIEDFEKKFSAAMDALTGGILSRNVIIREEHSGQWLAAMDGSYARLTDLLGDYVQRLDALQSALAANRSKVYEAASRAAERHCTLA
jgi:hypothetical protein